MNAWWERSTSRTSERTRSAKRIALLSERRPRDGSRLRLSRQGDAMDEVGRWPTRCLAAPRRSSAGASSSASAASSGSPSRATGRRWGSRSQGVARRARRVRPEKFSLPSRSDLRYHWVHVRLAALDAGEMRELVEDAWAFCAPKRVVEEVPGRAALRPSPPFEGSARAREARRSERWAPLAAASPPSWSLRSPSRARSPRSPRPRIPSRAEAADARGHGTREPFSRSLRPGARLDSSGGTAGEWLDRLPRPTPTSPDSRSQSRRTGFSSTGGRSVVSLVEVVARRAVGDFRLAPSPRSRALPPLELRTRSRRGQASPSASLVADAAARRRRRERRGPSPRGVGLVRERLASALPRRARLPRRRTILPAPVHEHDGARARRESTRSPARSRAAYPFGHRLAAVAAAAEARTITYAAVAQRPRAGCRSGGTPSPSRTRR